MSTYNLFQFRHRKDPPPSLEEVEREWEIEPGAADREYGVVKVADEEDDALYVVRVTPTAGERLRAAAGGSETGGTGVFSDPVIEPFGPPEP